MVEGGSSGEWPREGGGFGRGASRTCEANESMTTMSDEVAAIGRRRRRREERAMAISAGRAEHLPTTQAGGTASTGGRNWTPARRQVEGPSLPPPHHHLKEDEEAKVVARPTATRTKRRGRVAGGREEHEKRSMSAHASGRTVHPDYAAVSGGLTGLRWRGGGRRTRRGEARQPGGGKEMASEAEHRVWQRAARDLRENGFNYYWVAARGGAKAGSTAFPLSFFHSVSFLLLPTFRSGVSSNSGVVVLATRCLGIDSVGALADQALARPFELLPVVLTAGPRAVVPWEPCAVPAVTCRRGRAPALRRGASLLACWAWHPDLGLPMAAPPRRCLGLRAP
uniref:Uncharacterized protein n=1 Tax=Setaria viridis TaxID=4556 RepID=A0A4U6WIC9_SETVI|nr:hypothetical protein SEVIR_1G327600v2 [Setaria viridis]